MGAELWRCSCFILSKFFRNFFAKSLFKSCKMCYNSNVTAVGGASAVYAPLHFGKSFVKELIL